MPTFSIIFVVAVRPTQSFSSQEQQQTKQQLSYPYSIQAFNSTMFSQVASRYIARNITATTGRYGGGACGGGVFRYLSSSSSSTLKESYDNILVDITETGDATNKNIALITLNRPKALNALNDALFDDLLHATKVLDDDASIRCMVLTGSKKAFAAGADISEMKDKMYEECYATDMFSEWQQISKLRTPIIAAVSGFCLGGGCELAMMTDMSKTLYG